MFATITLFCFLAPSRLDTMRPDSLQNCGMQPPVYQDSRGHGVGLFAGSPGTPPEDNLDARPNGLSREGWRYPDFGSIVDTIESHVAKDRSSMDPGQNPMVYTLQEGFLPEDRFWIDYVRVDRMRRRSKVLYRPEIVRDLVQRIEELLASNTTRGLMVKGPLGVGKSYSLINLTRYLMATGKYWVTIIPNCEDWIHEYDFFKFLLQSVGVDPDHFYLDYDATSDKDFKKLIDDIDAVLNEHGMKWVFIFDQINRIFGRSDFLEATDVAALPFPFTMMQRVIKEGRIISIISAPDDNDLSQREYHEGFEIFKHSYRWDNDEINLLYPPHQVLTWDWNYMEYTTGRVPLYLVDWEKDGYGEVCEDIYVLLRKLRRTQKGNHWDDCVESAIQCLLHLSLTDPPRYLDPKFADQPRKYNHFALFPLAEEQHRKFFWNELSAYIKEREGDFLSVSNIVTTAGDLRRRLFADMVIARLVARCWSPDAFKSILADANVTIDEDCHADRRRPADMIRIPGFTYPDDDANATNLMTYFTAPAPSFSAVDFIIRLPKTVIAFQIHIADQDEVVTQLTKWVEKVGWHKEQVQKIILIYLSPTEDATRNLAKKMGGGTKFSEDDWVITRFRCINDFGLLRDIEWKD